MNRPNYLVYNDHGPDSQGRRSFFLLWWESDGIFRLGPGKDGYPVGFRRGQVFHAPPENYINSHTTVLESMEDAEAAVLRDSGKGPCFVDSGGVLRFIRDIPSDNLIFERRPVYEHGRYVNEWIEVMLLADPEEGEGREVIDSYVLHTTEDRLRATLRHDGAEEGLGTA